MKKAKANGPRLEGVRQSRPRMSPEELRRIRTRGLKWTREKLALEMGVTSTVVYLWETGRQQIPYSRGKHVKTLLKLTTLQREQSASAEQALAGEVLSAAPLKR